MDRMIIGGLFGILALAPLLWSTAGRGWTGAAVIAGSLVAWTIGFFGRRQLGKYPRFENIDRISPGFLVLNAAVIVALFGGIGLYLIFMLQMTVLATALIAVPLYLIYGAVWKDGCYIFCSPQIALSSATVALNLLAIYVYVTMN